MKKKIFGIILIISGIVYFFAVFRCMDYFETINGVVSYATFITAVIAIVVGVYVVTVPKSGGICE